MSRVSNALGYAGERAVLRDLTRSAQRRGWGMAVPLSPNFPADILDLRPSGPVFVEVKATRRKGRWSPSLSRAERAFAAECQERGVPMILATVRVGGTDRVPTYSLSYSPIPPVRVLVRRPLRPHVPGRGAEPTTDPGSGLGLSRRRRGTVDGTTAGATSSPPLGAPAEHECENPHGTGDPKADPEADQEEQTVP